MRRELRLKSAFRGLETAAPRVRRAYVAALSAFGLAVAAALPGAIGPALAQQDAARAAPLVIELYTSQGCSSCPPADRLLGQLAQRPGIIALSFPVAYWDHLGWRDTLARPGNAARQQAYADRLGGGLFTPEAVVNGMRTCVGSEPTAIEEALKETAGRLAKEAIPLTLRREAGRLIVETGAARAFARYKTGKVLVAAIRRHSEVAIGRGENAGRKITYTNAVLGLAEAGPWEGAATAYAVSLNALPKEWDELAVLLQAAPGGPIIGAAKIGE